MSSARSRRATFIARLLAWCAALVALPVLLAACERPGPNPGSRSKPGADSGAASAPAQTRGAATGHAPFTLLAGSEVKDLEAAMVEAARAAGVPLKIEYAGTLDIVERVNDGRQHLDAILPASGAYPALALQHKPLAREKLFYSRIALGVKDEKLRALGWDRQAPTWADIAAVAQSGRLRFAMTNPTSSNSGMSALFAVAAAVAGKTEDLKVQDIDAAKLSGFLDGQRLTAGSSGWLAEAYAREATRLDGMVNYEAVLLRTNEHLPAAQRLTPVFPTDGVISADYPLMLLDAERRDSYHALVVAFRSEAFQRKVAAGAYLRPALPGVPLAKGLSTAPVAELSFPNSLEVIESVLSTYQGEWRRPSTSIFVLDISGSMKGERMAAMRNALKVLSGSDGATASMRYARFQKRERVWLVPFNASVQEARELRFDEGQIDAARAAVRSIANDLVADGGTAIYRALERAQQIATAEEDRESGRFVSIVLLTDGVNNGTPDFGGFSRAMKSNGRMVRVFPILFGEANTDEMRALADLTGGRVFDGRKDALATVFKEIRGYQ